MNFLLLFSFFSFLRVTNEFEDVWAIQNEDDEEEAFYEQMKQMDAQKFIGNNSNNATNAQQDKIQKLEEKNEIMKQTFEMARTEFPWIEKYKDRSMTEVEYRMVHFFFFFFFSFLFFSFNVTYLFGKIDFRSKI